MIASVSKVSGTSGHRKTGSVSGNSPMSPTVRMSRSRNIASPVSTTMVTSGDGIALVTYGNR